MNKYLSAPVIFVVWLITLSYFVWEWGFCRFYIYPGSMAVITAKTGKSLSPGQILAKKGESGVQEDVLGEGRHFLNPWLYEVKIVSAIKIPPGKIGIVTSKIGQDLPQGQFLAEKGQKGIWKQVLGPGTYRLNPEGYHVDMVDAISIPLGYVGVITSLSGEQAPEGEFAGKNQKGVRQDVLQPGLYYANNKQVKIDLLEIGVNQVSLLGTEGAQVVTKTRFAGAQNQAISKLEENVLEAQQVQRESYMLDNASSLYSRSETKKQKDAGKVIPQAVSQKALATHPGQTPTAMEIEEFVEFPSRDGFEIRIDMTVEFEFLPKNIAWIYRNYGDLPAVVDKIIMPQIQSISRLKGSEYKAKDLIAGDGREKFQNELKSALEMTLGEKKLIVHNALIRHVTVPNQILDPIQKTSIAVQENLTNEEKQNTAKKQAALNTELSLIEQRGQQVGKETEKLKAEILADQEKQVATISAEAQKEVSRIEKEIAAIRADIVFKLGKAQADVVRMVEGEKANGFVLKTSAVNDSNAYNLYQFSVKLREDVPIHIIHAGPGTMWTDLQKATMGDLGGATMIQQNLK